MGNISLGFIVLAMHILIAQLPQVFPLSEDGGDHGDPGVAILLIGGFRAKVLWVVVSPCFGELALNELGPSNLLLTQGNVSHKFWNGDLAGVLLKEVTFELAEEEFLHVIWGVDSVHDSTKLV